MADSSAWHEPVMSLSDIDDPPYLSHLPKRRKLNHVVTAASSWMPNADEIPQKPKEILPNIMVQIMNEPDCPELVTSNEIFEKIKARHRYYAEVFSQKTLKGNISVYLSQNNQFMKRGMVGPAAPLSCWWSLTHPYSIKPLTCKAGPQNIKSQAGPAKTRLTHSHESMMRVDEMYHVKNNCSQNFEVQARHGAQMWTELPSLQMVKHMDEDFKLGEFIAIAVDIGGGKDREDIGQIFQLRQINEVSNAAAVFWFKNKSDGLRKCSKEHKKRWEEDDLQYMITNEVGVISMHTITSKANRSAILQLSAYTTVLDISKSQYKIVDFIDKEVAWMMNYLPRGQVHSSHVTTGVAQAQQQLKTPKRLAGLAAAKQITQSFSPAQDSAYESSPVSRGAEEEQPSASPIVEQEGSATSLARPTTPEVPQSSVELPASILNSSFLQPARLTEKRAYGGVDRSREVDSVLPETGPTKSVIKNKDEVVKWLRTKIDGFSAKDEVELEELEYYQALSQMVASDDGRHESSSAQQYGQNSSTIEADRRIARLEEKVSQLQEESNVFQTSMEEFQAWKDEVDPKLFPRANSATTPVWAAFGEQPPEAMKRQYQLPDGFVVFGDRDRYPMCRDDTRNDDGTLRYPDRYWRLPL